MDILFILGGILFVIILIGILKNYKPDLPDVAQAKRDIRRIEKEMKKTDIHSSQYTELLFQKGYVLYKCMHAIYSYTGCLDYDRELAFTYLSKAAKRNHTAAALYAGNIAFYRCVDDEFCPEYIAGCKNEVDSFRSRYGINRFGDQDTGSRVCGIYFYAKSYLLGSKEAEKQLNVLVTVFNWSRESIDYAIERVRTGKAGI